MWWEMEGVGPHLNTDYLCLMVDLEGSVLSILPQDAEGNTEGPGTASSEPLLPS